MPELSEIIGPIGKQIYELVAFLITVFTVLKIFLNWSKTTSKPGKQIFILEKPFDEAPSRKHMSAILIAIFITLLNFTVRINTEMPINMWSQPSINLGWVSLIILGYYSLRYGKSQGLLIALYCWLISIFFYCLFKDYSIHKVVFNKLLHFDLVYFNTYLSGRYMAYLVFFGYFAGLTKEKIMMHQLDNKFWFADSRIERKNFLVFCILFSISLIICVNFILNDMLEIRFFIFSPLLIIVVGLTMGSNTAFVFSLMHIIIVTSTQFSIGAMTIFTYMNGTDIFFLPLLGYFSGKILLVSNGNIIWNRVLLLCFSHFLFHQLRYIMFYGGLFYIKIITVVPPDPDLIFNTNFIVNTLALLPVFTVFVLMIALILKTKLYINNTCTSN